MSQLTRNEEIVLLAVLRIPEDAYGVRIKQRIHELTSDDWNYGLLYSTLDQLVKKGFLIKREGLPMPERGGRRKLFYSLSPSGRRALEQAYALKESIWRGISLPKLKRGRS
jgi:PadR family transcriptional regulator PadR